MKLLRIACFVAVSIAFLRNVSGQGFVNLDFEAANLSVYGAGPAAVPATNAIPGWTAYISGIPQTTISFNDVALNDAAISIQGTTGFEPAVAGRYSIFLQATYREIVTNTAAIGQTGSIPVGDQSLIFLGNLFLAGSIGNVQVTFNRQDLSLVAISNALNYTIYGADISPYAGQTGQLLFTANNNTYAELDNIQFSSLPIPEPSELALTAIGALFLGFHRWRKKLPNPR